MALPCSFSQMRLKQRRKWFHLKCIALGQLQQCLIESHTQIQDKLLIFFFQSHPQTADFFFFEAPETVHGQPHLSLFLGIKTCPGKKHSKGSERSTKASKVELAMLSMGSVIWGMGGQHTQDEVCLLLWHHAQPLSQTVATFSPRDGYKESKLNLFLYLLKQNLTRLPRLTLNVQFPCLSSRELAHISMPMRL